jgi:geranylgeranyl diphosphate synthase type I
MLSKEEKINSVLTKIAKIVDPVIEELLSFYVDPKYRDIVKYQIFTGGKRLRPALIITCCKLLDGRIKDAIYPAAGLEILHNYSLIIDDIIDNSNLRRQKPTLWAKFGRTIAQCISVDYSAAAFQAANLTKEPVKISELFAKTMKTVVNGEISDILFEQKERKEEPYIIKNRYQNITEKDYFKMVSKKTAILFQTCCEAGGIVASAKKKDLEALRNYGFNLGVAFQIKDDILDIFGEKKSITKKIGKDIREGKGGNIVILLALKELPKREKEKLLKIIRKRVIKNRDIIETLKLIRKTNSYQRAYQFSKSFVEKAKASLNLLPQNKWNTILREIADFAIEREK